MNLDLFSTRLRALREQRKLTLQSVGAAIGRTRHTIGNLENGRKSPSADMLIALADFYGVSLDYLTGRTDKPEINR